MSNKQDFIVKLERDALKDEFIIAKQTIPIDILLKGNAFNAIAYQINKACKNLESFSVKAFCLVETELSVDGYYTTLVHKVTIEHIVDYNNVIIYNKPIIIENLR